VVGGRAPKSNHDDKEAKETKQETKVKCARVVAVFPIFRAIHSFPFHFN
jgi:hypothetical protein